VINKATGTGGKRSNRPKNEKKEKRKRCGEAPQVCGTQKFRIQRRKDKHVARSSNRGRDAKKGFQKKGTGGCGDSQSGRRAKTEKCEKDSTNNWEGSSKNNVGL